MIPTYTALAERARRWRRRRRATRSTPEPAGHGCEQRWSALAERVDHLESALEGLQDAIYRREVLVNEQLEQVRRRIEPGQMARDLSDDARRRGL